MTSIEKTVKSEIDKWLKFNSSIKVLNNCIYKLWFKEIRAQIKICKRNLL